MFYKIALFLVISLYAFVGSALAQGELYDTPPVGLAGLHCNHPKAKESCDKIVKILYDSKIDEPAINYLVDGTFGFDADRMLNDIATLSEGGRILHVGFYLVNGPAQRKCGKNYSDGFAARICYKEFNKRILSDFQLQQDYQNNAARLLPVVKFALARGAHVYLSPMLEDNLNIGAFNHMINLILPNFPPQLNLHYVRNPSSTSDGKIPPADERIPYGFVKEKHPRKVKDINVWFGVMTNDGITYDLPNGPKVNEAKISFSTVKGMRDATHNRGGLFILWSRATQGAGGTRAEDRNYYVYNSQNESLLKDFLRGDGKLVTPTVPLPPGGDPSVPTPTPTPVPSPTPVPPGDVPVHFTCSSFISGKDGSGGFTNNPESSRKSMKVIWPGRYTDMISEVRVWSQDYSFSELLYRATPNEYGDNKGDGGRQRYYGRQPIASYPDNLTVSALLTNGQRICVSIPDPQKRLD